MCLSQLRAVLPHVAYLAVFVYFKHHFKILYQSMISAENNGPKVQKDQGTEFLKAI